MTDLAQEVRAAVYRIRSHKQLHEDWIAAADLIERIANAYDAQGERIKKMRETLSEITSDYEAGKEYADGEHGYWRDLCFEISECARAALSSEPGEKT